MTGNILDYLEWRGDISFEHSQLNSIDALIFATLSYVNYQGVTDDELTLAKAYELWEAQPEEDKLRGANSIQENCKILAKMVAECPRFKDVKLTNYIENTDVAMEKQFSAMTFILPAGDVFIAFRGTDSTIVGWKENFNSTFLDSTPAQNAASDYANKAAEKYPMSRLYIGGHSKGGNLSVWSAMHLPKESKARLVKVFNNDGPGFSDNVFASEDYMDIEDRILSYVPQSSVVGVLMGHCDYRTIKSTKVSIMQHDMFSWEIKGTDFEYVEERSLQGKLLEKQLNDIIDQLDPESFADFTGEVYQLLQEENIETVPELERNFVKCAVKLLPKYVNTKINDMWIEEKDERFPF
ncbi:MAG: DUF2974 domain-containing protein [Clostridia bacterium]|nr:DUF2974 domain-containing protein [Clostridia bacterium]